jgi:hypothetical protein
MMTFMVSFGSSVFSAIIESTVAEFETSANVTTLGISLYVLGMVAVAPGIRNVVEKPLLTFWGAGQDSRADL